MDSLTELGNPHDLKRMFNTPDYSKWHAFRDSEDARYVGLCLPRILMRRPYKSELMEGTFSFHEHVDGTDDEKYLWGNAAYAFVARLTYAVANVSCYEEYRLVDGWGLVHGLLVHTFNTDEGDVLSKGPNEVAISYRRTKELVELAFIPLVNCKNTDNATFVAAPSCHRPQLHHCQTRDHIVNDALLSDDLLGTMAALRLAHYWWSYKSIGHCSGDSWQVDFHHCDGR